MARLYGDENFDHQVIILLRGLGHDVMTIQDAGQANQRIPDKDVLAFATAENRAVLTFNRKDFFKLHQLILDHAGIIACTYDANYESIAQRIHETIMEENEILNTKLIRIRRPNG